MGLIADLDCPHILPNSKGRAMRTPTARCRVPSASEESEQNGVGAALHVDRADSPTGIRRDTPLVPRAVAEGVWEEASRHLGKELPAAWVDQLIARAEDIYLHAPRFRARLRGRGTSGRDWLWSFMRHWLSALVKEHRPALYRKLPGRYAVGGGIDLR